MDEETAIPQRSPRAGQRPPGAAARGIGIWLLACCGLLVALVLIGGITRLTRSGLSITEWKPILGFLPPLGADDWTEAFEKYRQTPEFKLVNSGMQLAEFQGIYGWEYVHRLVARLLGLAFLGPLLVLFARRRLDRSLAIRLVGVLMLGVAQGALGWYMVASGLVDDPQVSPVRLAAHLGLALTIFAALFWLALDQLQGRCAGLPAATRWRRSDLGAVLVLLIFLQVLSGGLVAGARAGFAYNTFPLMQGEWIPSGLLKLRPWMANFVENVITIQFGHRLLATLVLAAVTLVWVRALAGQGRGGTTARAGLLVAMVSLQMALGVATLLLRVPLVLGVAHQAGGIVLFAATLLNAHAARTSG